MKNLLNCSFRYFLTNICHKQINCEKNKPVCKEFFTRLIQVIDSHWMMGQLLLTKFYCSPFVCFCWIRIFSVTEFWWKYAPWSHHCLSGSLILHIKLPGKRCGHFLSLGCALRSRVHCQDLWVLKEVHMEMQHNLGF